MANLTLYTFDWVPERVRGFVRDLRVRWALEEAGLPYGVGTTPLGEKTAEHFLHQPFGQVPWITDGDQSIFESGAILLHLGARSDALLPTDPAMRAEATQWVLAALNSVEIAVLPWSILKFSGDAEDTPAFERLAGFMSTRLGQMETVLSGRKWLAGRFTVADILMADTLRQADGFDALADLPACRDYVARATARPAYKKAHADQLAHFARADEMA